MNPTMCPGSFAVWYAVTSALERYRCRRGEPSLDDRVAGRLHLAEWASAKVEGLRWRRARSSPRGPAGTRTQRILRVARFRQSPATPACCTHSARSLGNLATLRVQLTCSQMPSRAGVIRLQRSGSGSWLTRWSGPIGWTKRRVHSARPWKQRLETRQLGWTSRAVCMASAICGGRR
jgi:hypothetical protein